MRTRCPAPWCRAEYDVPLAGDRPEGPCPACGSLVSFRPLDHWVQIDRQHARRTRRRAGESVAGAPLVPYSAVLEDVRSGWNVGSIFRTADGAGFSVLHLCGITGTPDDPAVTKTSLGAEGHVGWEHWTSCLDVLPGLVRRGARVVALERSSTSEPLEDVVRSGVLTPPVVLVVGNEITGVSAEARQLAAKVCHLPMRGVKGSLNVAVAFGIAAYRIREG